jgi:dolichyl-phosphate-mannose--protein O-mannosyl transferase
LRALRAEGLPIVILLGLVPVAVYLAVYIGRVPGDALALPWQEGTWWRNVWEHQQAMLTFHTTLAGNHPYESPPWSWLLLKRPVAYFFSAEGGTYREILAIGNPLAWWAGVAALLALAVAWARRGWRLGHPAAVLVTAALATYLPWLALSGSRSQVFIWYILPAIPFLYAAIGLVTARAWARRAGRVATVVFAAASLALFAFFFPILTALPLEPDGWRSRIWLTNCARPDSPTLELPDDEISSGQPPDGWCWI